VRRVGNMEACVTRQRSHPASPLDVVSKLLLLGVVWKPPLL
jgi:hypothetical protein